MKQLQNMFTFIFFCVNLCDSEYSTKWDVKTKSIKIGGEVILNCNLNTCPTSMKKAWYGGEPYDLLCYDNISTNALKYEMILHNTTLKYDLMIKNFNLLDINCEYTCACGFHQDSKMLRLDDLDFVWECDCRGDNVSYMCTSLCRRCPHNSCYDRESDSRILLFNRSNGDIIDSSKLKDDRLVIAVKMKVYPIPKCSISYKFKEYNMLVNIIGIVTSDGNVSGPYIVTMNNSLHMTECKVFIYLTCQAGTSKYYVHNLDFNTCEDEIDSDLPLVILGISISLILALFGFILKWKRRKKQCVNGNGNADANQHSTPCLAHALNDNTGATDDGTPWNKKVPKQLESTFINTENLLSK